jgi:uncharacterized cupredoxin-like copper-binding protein
MRVSHVLCVAALSGPTLTFAAGAHSGGHGSASGKPGTVAEVDRTIQIEMRDNYYEPEQIEASTGETIRFVVENKGSLVHEFNIGTPSMHDAHQKQMAMMVEHGVIQGGKLHQEKMGMDMGNGHSMQHNDPNSVLLEPGQRKEVIWTFSKKNNIEFACNVPGHYQAGMYGEIQFN